METRSAYSDESIARQPHPENRGMRPWRALGMVRRLEFETPDYHFVAAPFSGDAPVLEGRVHEAQLQPGLWLHCAEVVDLHNMASRVVLDAGLRLVVVLAGELDVSIGGHRLHLRAGGAPQASAAVVGMPQAAMFERRWKRGKWERKLSLHFTPEWLQGHAGVCQADGQGVSDPHVWSLPVPMSGDDLCVLPWNPSAHAISIAEQLMLDADSAASGLQRLRQSGRALELLYEALAGRDTAAAPTPVVAGLRLRDHERMLRLRGFLDAEIHQPYVQPLTVDALGRRFGLSASALQRQFRQAFGSSINEYRRSMRLLQARADLERGSAVGEAASRAGYTSAANFSTAFRRQFGISPRDLRIRS